MNRRIRRAAAFVPRHVAFALLAPLERRLLSSAPSGGSPPVFVLGPPRSGTTLAFDLLVSRYRLAYFSTLANRLWQVPASATRLGRRTIRAYRGRFESRYGHIAAWGGPNEGGEVWKSWYDESGVLTEVDAAAIDSERIRRTVRSVAATLGGPFVSKNVMHGLHMRFLDALFPSCLFVELRRSRAEIARSLLRARHAFGGEAGMREWISIRPPGHEAYLDASPVTQVCAQIVLTQSMIASEAERLGAERVMKIEYERLCAAPGEVLTEFGAFYAGRVGDRLIDRDFEPPDLSRSSSKLMDAGTEEEIEVELARLGSLHGAAA